MARKRAKKGFGFSVVDFQNALIVVFVLMALSPPATPHKSSIELQPMTVELTWDMARNADVDLWVQTPDDLQPVGYRRTHGRHADLDHDDLGRTHTVDSRNLELTAVRSTPAGEYIINAILFNSYDNVYPVPVHLQVFYGDARTAVFDVHENLTFDTQERTLVRFTLGQHGAISNVNYLQRSLGG